MAVVLKIFLNEVAEYDYHDNLRGGVYLLSKISILISTANRFAFLELFLLRNFQLLERNLIGEN